MADRPSVTSGNRLTRRGFLAAGAAGISAVAGCLVHGQDSGLRGVITMDGSDTVLPHGAAVAYEFQWNNNRVRIPVSGSGTGAGFQRFGRGRSVVQNASRPILPGEEELCEKNGVEYVEMEMLLDGLAVFVNPENTWCECLTIDQLAAMWEFGSEIDTWGDVNSEWPDEAVKFFGRDSASGTFDTFTERVTGSIGNIRSDYSKTSDTNVIVRGVRENPNAIGFGGAGHYYENEDDLKLVALDDPDNGGDGCIVPRRETIEDRLYTPLTRSMYVYVNKDALAREEVRAFARFYFEEIDEETHEYAVEKGIAQPDESLRWTQWAAREVGYYAVADDVIEDSEQRLEDAIAEVA